MKFEVDSLTQLNLWLAGPVPAVFQGMDLRPHASMVERQSLLSCAFLGCDLAPSTAALAAAAGCTVRPRFANLPFDAFKPSLYTPNELYDRFDPADPASYEHCLDRLIYASAMDPQTKKRLAADAEMVLAQRMHDASISEALDDVLDLTARKRTVAFMGGHDRPRDGTEFAQVAKLAQALAQKGLLVLTGGGPGLMEAANLGAYTAGFADPSAALMEVLAAIKSAPKYDHPAWLSTAFQAWQSLGAPHNQALSRNIGVPTWFYGHEPPNVFATDIAKYFENSVREEGLLAVALAGVIFAPGNAGTVQELFQDACQNYYKTYDDQQSSMVLFGVDYWAPATMSRHTPGDRRKSVYPLLEKLAQEKGFGQKLLLTDDPAAVISFINILP